MSAHLSRWRAVPGPIERASGGDLSALASDLPGAPAVVAAVVVLSAGTEIDLVGVRRAIGLRLGGVPRLRQRLVRAPLGCGRPLWVDDPGFDLDQHVLAVVAGESAEQALLDVAAEVVMRPLPPDRPLWAAYVVTGRVGGGAAMIFVLHHVLADGIGGLAVLAGLADGFSPPLDEVDEVDEVDEPAGPARAPTRGALARDALRSRVRAVIRAGAGFRRLRAAVRELAPSGVPHAARSSLNRPTGPTRRLAVVRIDLAPVHRVAHADGCTVNDVVLTAVAGALGETLRHRGEPAGQVVVSVPVSRRRGTTATALGNTVGAMPVELPCREGDVLHRLRATGRATRAAKAVVPGESDALLGPVLRAMAALGVLRWFLDRQHLITTFVTDLPGPPARLQLFGATVTAVIPVPPITGNVTVAFAALSYAGTLVITVVADPGRWADLPVLVTALQRQLDALVASSSPLPG